MAISKNYRSNYIPAFPANYNLIILLMFLLVLLRGVIYASLVPPWQAPDETAQFERVRASLTASEWNSTSENPPGWYGDIVNSMFAFDHWDFIDAPRQSYSPSAPVNRYIALYQEIYDGLYGSRLAYLIMGLPLFLAHDNDITFQLYLVRLQTVVMNICIVALAYLTTRLIFPGDPFLTLGVPLLITFNPQHTHLLSTVNNGNLAELLATAALYFIVRGITSGFTWLNILASFSLTVAAMWTKATAYFLPFVLITICLFYLWRYRKQWRWLLPVAIVLTGLIIYFSPARLRILLSWGWGGLITGSFYLDPIVPLDLFRSFWAMPGAAIILLHPHWYQLLATFCVLAFVGLILLFFNKWPLIFVESYRPKLQSLLVLAVALTVAVVTLLSWNAITQTIVYRQGRSVYPVIVPISLFLMLGWRQLVPPARRQLGLVGITVAMFLFDFMALIQYIVPFFYSRY